MTISFETPLDEWRCGCSDISIAVSSAFRGRRAPERQNLSDNDNNNSSQNDDSIHFLVEPKQ